MPVGLCIPRMRNVTPIVKNAIQAVVPRNIIAIATARKTIPIGRNAVPPLLFSGPLDSDMGFLSPFTWPTLRGRTETRKCFRDWGAAAERMVGDQEDRAVMKSAATIEPPRILLVEATPFAGIGCDVSTFGFARGREVSCFNS